MSYKFRITIDKTKVLGTNTDFVYLFSELCSNIPSGFWSHVIQGDGSDIKFFDSIETTELKREIVLYDSINHKVEAWVKVSSVDDVSNTQIWCEYGGSSRVNDTDTWGSDWFVYHLQNNASDSSVNGNDGVVDGALSTDGKIQKAYNFDGVTNHVTLNNPIDFSGNIIVKAWVYFYDLPTSTGPNPFGVYSIVSRAKQCSSTTRGWRSFDFVLNDSGQVQLLISKTNSCGGGFNYDGYSSSSSISTNAWHRLILSSSNNSSLSRSVDIYIDGLLDTVNFTQYGGSRAGFVQDPDFLTLIGADNKDDGSTHENLYGIVDEVIIENSSSITVGYALTEYNNQNDPSSFASCESEISAGAITVNASSVIYSASVIDPTIIAFSSIVVNVSAEAIYSASILAPNIIIPLIAPVLTYPPNNSSGIAQSVLFQWNAVVGADSYDVQVSPDPTFTFIERFGSTTSTSRAFTHYAMTNNTWYYFRVRAVSNISGPGLWGTNTFYVGVLPTPGVIVHPNTVAMLSRINDPIIICTGNSFYCDLNDLTTGHAGTQLDPWSWEDVCNSGVLTKGDTIYMRGSIDTTLYPVWGHLNMGAPYLIVTFDKWGNDPWKLRFDNQFGETQSFINFKNGIIYAVHGIIVYQASNCIIVAEGRMGGVFATGAGYDIYFLSYESNPISFHENTFISTYGGIIGNLNPIVPYYNCLFASQFAYHLLFPVDTGSCQAINCTFTYGRAYNIVLAPGSSNNQINWFPNGSGGPAVWPVFTDPKEAWTFDLFVAEGITAPPNPGHFPYTEIYDPWRNPRYGIGAFYFVPGGGVIVTPNSCVYNARAIDPEINPSRATYVLPASSILQVYTSPFYQVLAGGVPDFLATSDMPDEWLRKCDGQDYENEREVYRDLTTEAYNRFGVCLTYYIVSYDPRYDKIWGEDNNRRFVRKFDIMGFYPLNTEEKMWTKFAIQGIDEFSMFVSKDHFRVACTYGDTKVAGNIGPGTYPIYIPKEGDVVQSMYNKYLYEITNVKEEAMMVHLSKRYVWELVVRPYMDEHLSLDPTTSASMGNVSAFVGTNPDILDVSNQAISAAGATAYKPKSCELPPRDPFGGW